MKPQWLAVLTIKTGRSFVRAQRSSVFLLCSLPTFSSNHGAQVAEAEVLMPISKSIEIIDRTFISYSLFPNILDFLRAPLSFGLSMQSDDAILRAYSNGLRYFGQRPSRGFNVI